LYWMGFDDGVVFLSKKSKLLTQLPPFKI